MRDGTKTCESASCVVNRELGGHRSVVEGNGASDEARAVFSPSKGMVNTRCENQDFGAVFSWRVSKLGRKLRRRTWAMRRWGDLVYSVVRQMQATIEVHNDFAFEGWSLRRALHLTPK